MKLNRANLATQTGVVEATPTERIVHIGLGAFHRAHQAWFTAQVDTEKQWGIVAITGRSAKAAEELASQDGLFTLITRSEVDDQLAEDDRNLVEKIDFALRRLEAGTYGQCTGCGAEIPLARLEAKPSVSLCIACQEKKDAEAE